MIGRPPLEPGEGLWIHPCRQVHMFWMRYPIDVVFLSADHEVLHVVADLRPWCVSPKIAGAESVIELGAGQAAARRIEAGARLTIAPAGA